VDLDGVSVCAVTPGMLYRMKRGPVRPKDWAETSDAGTQVSRRQRHGGYALDERTDPALPRAIARVWDFAARICPLQFPRGVHKYRSIEEADAERERWEEANFRAFHERKRARATSPSTD
jgi:hypothetical protein